MELLTKLLKIFFLILLFSSVCYSVYPKNRILDNSGHRDKSTTTTSSSRIIDPQPSTSEGQNSISVIKKTYESHVDENGQRKYLCTDCAYQSSISSNTSRHWHIKHGIKAFKCSGCNYEASLKSQLKQHEIIFHQGLRPYRCNYCTYEGSTKRGLIVHENSEHLNLKEYKCTQCQCETAIKGNLKQHMERRHSGPQ